MLWPKYIWYTVTPSCCRRYICVQGNVQRTALCWHRGQEEQQQSEATFYSLEILTLESIYLYRPRCSIKVSRTKILILPPRCPLPQGASHRLGLVSRKKAQNLCCLKTHLVQQRSVIEFCSDSDNAACGPKSFYKCWTFAAYPVSVWRTKQILQARDLSTNFMAAEEPSKGSKAGEGENKQTPEAPRPKGAPNRFNFNPLHCPQHFSPDLFPRAKHPPGGASHGSLWWLPEKNSFS